MGATERRAYLSFSRLRLSLFLSLHFEVLLGREILSYQNEFFLVSVLMWRKCRKRSPKSRFVCHLCECQQFCCHWDSLLRLSSEWLKGGPIWEKGRVRNAANRHSSIAKNDQPCPFWGTLWRTQLVHKRPFEICKDKSPPLAYVQSWSFEATLIGLLEKPISEWYNLNSFALLNWDITAYWHEW